MANDLAEIIDSTEVRFEKIAPKGLSFTAEQAFAIQHLNNNAYLKKAAMENPDSLKFAMINVGAVGLSLNPAEHLAYLIPRNVKVSSNPDRYQTRVFYDPGYQGLIRLATNSGSIEWCQAQLVYFDDEFMPQAPGERPFHKYDPFEEDRGIFKGVYCVAKTHGGDYLVTTMSVLEIVEIMNRSEAYKKGFGPWKTDKLEMTKKAVIRRAFKTWPRSNQTSTMAQAVQLSNENEGFAPIPTTAPELTQFTANEKELFDQMITGDDALGMYILSQTTSAQVMASLHNSFEKGSIVKYKAIVNDMLDQGRSMFCDYQNNYDPEQDIDQFQGEVSDEAYALIMERS